MLNSYVERFYQRSSLARDVRAIFSQLLALDTKVNTIMKTEQNLSDDLDAIQAGVTAALAAQADLKAQIAALVAGEPVNQAQLDALVEKADAIAASLTPAPAATDQADGAGSAQ